MLTRKKSHYRIELFSDRSMDEIPDTNESFFIEKTLLYRHLLVGLRIEKNIKSIQGSLIKDNLLIINSNTGGNFGIRK